jgi:uncharacterized protein involved in response to NO
MEKFIKKIKEIFRKLLGSLDNYTSDSFSGRKLTALAAFWTAFELSQTLEGDNRLYAVYAFLGTGLLCLGIVTVQNLVEFKNGKQQ